MAAPVLTVTAIAVDAAYDDLTTITGGNSRDIGHTGSTFTLNGSQFATVKKASGLGELIETFFNDSGSTLVPAFTTHRTKTFQAHDALDSTDADTFTVDYSSNSSQFLSIPIAQINSGSLFTMFADQKLRRFTWTGALTQGTYVVTATVGDASIAPVVLSLGAVVGKTDKWFQVSCRTLASTTLVVEIRRTVSTASAGLIYTQGGVIEPPTLPAKPRGWKNLRLHRANQR